MNYRTLLYTCFIFLSLATIVTIVGTTQKEGKTVTLGLVAKSRSNPVFIAAYAGARVAAREIGEKYGIEVKIDWQTPPEESSQEQAQAIEQLSRSGAGGIAIACSGEHILASSIDKAVDRGIPVICFDSDAPQSKRFAYYGSDNIEFGRMIMQELAREMNEKGIIAILAGNKNAPNLKQRVQAILDELKKYPSMKLVKSGVCYHEEIPEKAAEVVSRVQKANPQIGGWAFVGGWPLWAKNAIKWKPGQVKIVAADALPEELEYLRSGHVQVLIAQNCFLWGYQSVVILLNKIVKNQEPAQQMNVGPLVRVTKDNLDEWSLNWKKWLVKEAVYR
ncbi:MAG: substrate-binding domain-containing protein [Bacteroidota bacterium]